MADLVLVPGRLTLAQLRAIAHGGVRLTLDPAAIPVLEQGAAAVRAIVAKGEPAYGINTGFGRLATEHIPDDQIDLLQRNLVLSHAVGVGRPLPAGVVRLMLATKVSSLGRGHSGARPAVVEALLRLFNADVLPVIPEKGSVGASGDLAPLAHLSAVLLGIGEAFVRASAGRHSRPWRLRGSLPSRSRPRKAWHFSTARRRPPRWHSSTSSRSRTSSATALVSGALAVDAAAGSVKPFDARIHALRGQPGQVDSAAAYRSLLEGSDINLSHRDCGKVQDPYSLRCQPQVMGACLDQIRHAAGVLLREANAVSDNPLVFPDTLEVLSGGNFHGEPVAFAADNLALAVAEIGALAERRIALLIDATLSGLPPFLVSDGGVNSGFMIAHVTAAALASENKSLAHPASVDSLPTSANQEDHVSMSAFAARRLGDMAENTAGILAIELLAAAQGVDLRAPHRTSPALQRVLDEIRAQGSALRHRPLFRAGHRHDRRRRDGRRLRDAFAAALRLAGRAHDAMTAPAWKKIHDHVLGKIRAGRWVEGDRVPSESELCARFGVARMTVGRAIRELAAAQHVVRVKGAGTFVAPPRHHSTVVEIRNIADEIAASGRRHEAEVLLVEKAHGRRGARHADGREARHAALSRAPPAPRRRRAPPARGTVGEPRARAGFPRPGLHAHDAQRIPHAGRAARAGRIRHRGTPARYGNAPAPRHGPRRALPAASPADVVRGASGLGRPALASRKPAPVHGAVLTWARISLPGPAGEANGVGADGERWLAADGE